MSRTRGSIPHERRRETAGFRRGGSSALQLQPKIIKLTKRSGAADTVSDNLPDGVMSFKSFVEQVPEWADPSTSFVFTAIILT